MWTTSYLTFGRALSAQSIRSKGETCSDLSVTKAATSRCVDGVVCSTDARRHLWTKAPENGLKWRARKLD